MDHTLVVVIEAALCGSAVGASLRFAQLLGELVKYVQIKRMLLLTHMHVEKLNELKDLGWSVKP